MRPKWAVGKRGDDMDIAQEIAAWNGKSAEGIERVCHHTEHFMNSVAEHAKYVEAFLRKTPTDSNKFVRAWSYHELYKPARHHAEYRDELEATFETAMRNEAASVRDRIRAVMKNGL